jgi:hypothetical protein
MSDIKPGDIVRHKRDKDLVRGVVLEISRSRERARVEWGDMNNPTLKNPRLYWTHRAYYRLDLLEKVEG